MKEKHLSDDAKENTGTVVHAFKREGAGMFAPQDIISITAQGGLTICVSGHCITKHPEEWHAMAREYGIIVSEGATANVENCRFEK